MSIIERTRSTLRRLRPLPSGRQVVLHLGSQKTGTTAVQAWCREHATELLQAGVVTRTTQPQIRTALGGWYDVARPGADARLRAFLESTWRTTQVPGLFYSCESNTGPAFVSDSPELYPRLTANLDGVARATARVPRHVQFCVRGYAGFLESAYQQQLKHGRPMRFGELYDRVADRLSWRPVVTTLIRTFGAEHVTVYDYDADRTPSTPLVGQILGDALDLLGAGDVVVTEAARRTNTRYTQRMADLSLAVLPHLTTRSERESFHQFLTAALGRHPAAGDAPAAFLATADASVLDERYAEDLAWIAGEVGLR